MRVVFPVGIPATNVPNAPTHVTTIAKDTAVTVTWQAPVAGPAPTGYKITPYIAGAAQAAQTVGNVTSADATGLTNGTAYTFTVKGTNASGDGAESTQSGANTPRLNQVFGDEFNGIYIDPAWEVHNRDDDHHDAYELPAQVSMDGLGNLVITVTKQSFTGPEYNDSTYPANSGTVTKNFRTGLIQWNTFNVVPTTGKTVKVQVGVTSTMPIDSTGPDPVIWMLGLNCEASFQLNPDNVGTCNWPADGSAEIDIMEAGVNGGGSTTSANQQLHLTGNGDTGGNTSVSDMSANSHVWEIDWTLSQIQWFVDGSLTKTVSSPVPQQALFLILDLEVHAGCDVVNPQSWKIDYARAFIQ